MRAMKTFRAGIIQFDVVLGQVNQNVRTVQTRLATLAGSDVDLVVLPEMWSCGFDNDHLAAHARKTPGILDYLCGFAKKKKMIIAGSLPENVDGNVANTFYVIDEKGEIASQYRKIHLFSPGNEHLNFTAGKAIVARELSVGKIGLITCYDLRFPELSRRLTLKGVELLMVSAQWPKSRKDHWDVLLRARAIENQVFVLGANRCGMDPNLEYAGNSRIISPWGEIFAYGDESEAMLVADLHSEALTQAREGIPCLSDRRPDVYHSKKEVGS